MKKIYYYEIVWKVMIEEGAPDALVIEDAVKEG